MTVTRYQQAAEGMVMKVAELDIEYFNVSRSYRRLWVHTEHAPDSYRFSINRLVVTCTSSMHEQDPSIDLQVLLQSLSRLLILQPISRTIISNSPLTLNQGM